MYTADVSPDSKYEDSVETAAKRLRSFLDPKGLCGADLLLLINFDEAHSLTDQIRVGCSWTRFSVLRRALRALNDVPFFTIFLSTAGQFHNFNLHREDEVSQRMQDGTLTAFQPITAVGFDQFAERVAIDGTWNLARLASTYHMAHLGRAL